MPLLLQLATLRHFEILFTCQVKPGFQIVVPVARIVSVASNFWKQQGRSYGNALAITLGDHCDRNDQSSETETRVPSLRQRRPEMTLERSHILNGNRVQTIETTEALGHIP